ncbi:hypothetical protein THAOC_22963, partial [Thalassiosira oceanica]
FQRLNRGPAEGIANRKGRTTMTFTSVARSCLSVAGRRCPAARVSGGNATATMRRRMGGGQPVSRSMEAELWQGHPKEPEGWETTVYLVYGGTAVMLALALGFAPDTSIKTVRLRLKHGRL